MLVFINFFTIPYESHEIKAINRDMNQKEQEKKKMMEFDDGTKNKYKNEKKYYAKLNKYFFVVVACRMLLLFTLIYHMVLESKTSFYRDFNMITESRKEKNTTKSMKRNRILLYEHAYSHLYCWNSCTCELVYIDRHTHT